MARGLNKVMMIGYLGGDPETRYVPSGSAVTTFSIGVTESWKDKQSGETKEATEWMQCETWGKLAEICAEYLRKGSRVYLEGSFKTDKWEDKVTNAPKSRTKVRVDNMMMLDSKGDQRPPVDRTQPPERNDKKQESFDDDIPF